MLTITSLVKTFRSDSDVVNAVDDVSLDVVPGELLVLLGPSGCGKTTLLRCVAGLESAASGTIAFGERVVYDSERQIDVPPNKRNVGMCFQSYALWPHKTVRKNIEYPLKVRGMRGKLGWVEEAAELVDCGHLLDRYPGQLSGGQQQRVALARGLVARPELLLFDEPLSNLDALLRNQVRAELHSLHGRIGFTGVYVTHDQSEALALGDRLAIMRAGRVEQLGRPAEVYEHPVSEYAAHFVGFSNQVVLRRTADGSRRLRVRRARRLRGDGGGRGLCRCARRGDVALRIAVAERSTTGRNRAFRCRRDGRGTRATGPASSFHTRRRCT